MANLGVKNGIYHVRFRFNGSEFKKSLKLRDKNEAVLALGLVEKTLHRLRTGEWQIPDGIDAGDFIVSGGTLRESVTTHKNKSQQRLSSTSDLIHEYLAHQFHSLSPNYLALQTIHLRHFRRFLADLADAPGDNVSDRHLERYLHLRLDERQPTTVSKERNTLIQFYRWLTKKKYLDNSPAAALEPIKFGIDRPAFRTVEEINRILKRGGLSDEERSGLWDCLYLTPKEIAVLLKTIHNRASVDYCHLLHAIPAYTGIRRGEILRLRWLDIDLEDDCLSARSRKQSRSQLEKVRSIDLHPELKSLLVAWRKQRPKGQYVLCDAKDLAPIREDEANRVFWQPMRGTEWCLDSKKNWFKVGFHTYRHSFASNLAAAGVDQRIIDQWMGHQTEEMRQRYRHLFPRDRRSAIETFSLQSAGHD